MALGQLRLSLTIALVLPGATPGAFSHPTRHCPWLFTLGLIFTDRFELLDTLLEPPLVDQTPPRGMGGDSRAIQGATLSRGQFRLNRLMQELGIESVDVSTGTVTKLIPAAARGADAKTQPPKRIALVRVSVPLAGLALPAPQFKEHDGEHEVGPMRRFATAAISLVERR
jgi:hypothetical protein